MKTLVTGFGPFKGFDINPSQIIVEQLNDREDIKTVIFDVNQNAISSTYPPILEEYQPDLILNIGLQASTGVLNLETFAINSLKDQEEFQTIQEMSGFKTSINTNRLAQELCDIGIPAIRSDHAGNYYCNYIYYLSLQWCQGGKGNALFLHIPFTTKLASIYCKAKKTSFSSLNEKIILKGIDYIILDQKKNLLA